MSRWFRYYDDALDDPKVQSLSADLFKTWVNLLCIASKNDGLLPESDLPFRLRMDVGKASKQVQELLRRGLLDPIGGGYEPHNWSDRQFKSDVSTERVKQFRKRKRNVSETLHETPPDTETETEQNKGSEPNGSGAEAPVDFEVLVFRRGKAVLGKSAGGVISQLKRHCRDDLTATMSLIDQAAQKENPMEWVQAFLRKPDPDAEIYRNVL